MKNSIEHRALTDETDCNSKRNAFSDILPDVIEAIRGATYKREGATLKTLVELAMEDILSAVGKAREMNGIRERNMEERCEVEPTVEEIHLDPESVDMLCGLIGCTPDEISTKAEEAIKGGKKVHIGNLNLNDTHYDYLELPEIVIGDFNMHNIRFIEEFKLPTVVVGRSRFYHLRAALNLKFPEVIGEFMTLDYLSMVQNVTFPAKIPSLHIPCLCSAQGAQFPAEMDGGLDLQGLKTAEGLVLPSSLKNLNLNCLQSGQGLVLPRVIRGGLVLTFLQSLEGVSMPEVVEGNLFINQINSQDARGMTTRVKGKISFKDYVQQ